MRFHAVAFVFARGGSKGVPGKNLREAGGQPLLARAIDVARAAQAVERILVSTEDPKIAAAARRFGAEVPFMRPAELADDRSPEWLSWQHAVRWLERGSGGVPDAFVSVPTTSPLRVPADIDACVERLARGDVDAVVTVTPAARSPYFNMVTVDEAGLAHIVIAPGARVHRRQEGPVVYDITTVCYAARPDFVLSSTGLFEGRVGVVEIPQERSLDIDTSFDFQVADLLLRERESRGRRDV